MKSRVHRSIALSLLCLAALSGCDPDLSAKVNHSDVATDAAIPPDAPRLRLRVSGNLGGYLKPCGCASGQLGGLGRRAFRNKLDGHNIDVFLEGGNLIKQAGELEFFKLYAALEILSMGEFAYQAIGISATDLTLDRDKLTSLLDAFSCLASDLVQADGKPWTHKGKPVIAAFREARLDHVTVRIASLMMSLPKGDAGEGLALLPPQEAWTRALAGAADETYRVVMIHASGPTIKKLRLDPKPDLIVSINNDYVEPPPTAHRAGDVPLVFVGIYGRVLLDVTVVRGPAGAVITQYAPVALKGSQTAKDAMRDADALAVILGHRNMVKQAGMLEQLAGLKALPGNATYVGAQKCAECHDDDSDTCAKHAHSRAWQTLIDAEKREKWPVTHYPECVSCHVVGYGYKSGFVNPAKTPKLLNVTCENCHGPGSVHAGDDSKSIPSPRPGVKVCTECHNFEHSPKFDYTKYWKMIQHGR